MKRNIFNRIEKYRVYLLLGFLCLIVCTQGWAVSFTKVSQELTNLPGVLSWSADNQTLVFHLWDTTMDGWPGMGKATYNLFTIPSRGGQRTTLTATFYFEIDPDWSPDGKWIAMASDGGTQQAEYEIWLMSPTDSAPSLRLTNLVDPRNQIHEQNTTPSWSPDSQEIAFKRCSREWYAQFPTNSDIWAVNIKSKTLRRVTYTNSEGVNYPSWSPDGTCIAYWLGLDLYTIPATGGNPTKLVTVSNGTSTGKVSWSPDGDYIVFHQLDFDAGGGPKL